jgi:hypothetical protein
MADKPRTFEEVVAAADPDVRERMERAELYRMGAVTRRPFARPCGRI